MSYEPIEKSASKFVHSYGVWFEDLCLPESVLIGEEGEGFYQVLAPRSY